MQNYLDKGIHAVITKIQDYINWVSALSFVLFDFFINNLDDGIENMRIDMGSTFQDVQQLKNIQKKAWIIINADTINSVEKLPKMTTYYPDFQYIKGYCKGNGINCQRSNGSKLQQERFRQNENLFKGKNNEVLE